MATALHGPATSVLIVSEDDALLRRVRRSLRGSEFEGSAHIARTVASAKREAVRCDCVVLVSEMHDHSLAETVEELVDAGAPIVVLGKDDGAELLGVVRAGAAGYFPAAAGEGLAQAVRAAARGEAVLPRRLLNDLFDAIKVRHLEDVAVESSVPRLTAREWEVLRLLQEGHATHVIARRLYVSPVTVRSHVHALMHKFRVSDRHELMDKTRGLDRRRAPRE
ncbi:MAG: LuxR C-terminal-related transcriptional regulator [Actinomycetales bacterium]